MVHFNQFCPIVTIFWTKLYKMGSVGGNGEVEQKQLRMTDSLENTLIFIHITFLDIESDALQISTILETQLCLKISIIMLSGVEWVMLILHFTSDMSDNIRIELDGEHKT